MNSRTRQGRAQELERPPSFTDRSTVHGYSAHSNKCQFVLDKCSALLGAHKLPIGNGLSHRHVSTQVKKENQVFHYRGTLEGSTMRSWCTAPGGFCPPRGIPGVAPMRAAASASRFWHVAALLLLHHHLLLLLNLQRVHVRHDVNADRAVRIASLLYRLLVCREVFCKSSDGCTGTVVHLPLTDSPSSDRSVIS